MDEAFPDGVCEQQNQIYMHIGYTHSYFCLGFVVVLVVSSTNTGLFLITYCHQFEGSKPRILDSNKFEDNPLSHRTPFGFETANYCFLLFTKFCCENFSWIISTNLLPWKKESYCVHWVHQKYFGLTNKFGLEPVSLSNSN